MKVAKSIILSVILSLFLASPTLAEETPSITQYIDYIRSLKIIPPEGAALTLEGREFNLTVELYIHKLRYESEDTFKSMVKETMFPEDAVLTLDAKEFQAIATEVSLGLIDDDTAIAQLQAIGTIYSSIDGTFTGWTGETRFPLQNGQVWQQSSYSYTYHYAYAPKVTIYKSDGVYKMNVEGVEGTIDVVRLK